MEFRLLGEVEAWSMDRRVELGPTKQRLLLAVLALRVNRRVSVESLVDLTWPHSPPPTARHAVHVRVSQLRAALASGDPGLSGTRIVTGQSAYTLQADPMSVDTHRFRALVSTARVEGADEAKVALYRRAFALWQGQPLADVAGAEIVERLCAGLNEARLVAQEECLDAELRLGRHREVLDELAEHIAQQPLRQHVVAQHMLALYRSGRSSEALRAYSSARSRMVAELGLEPQPRLKRLEQAILRADPSLEAAPVPVVRRPWVLHPNGRLAVDVDRLSRRFGTVIAVENLSFGVRPGEIVGLLGPDGAGKTTILRLLSTLVAPSSGTFSIAGVPHSRSRDIRRKVGVSPAARCGPGHLTGQDYLRYHARLFGVGRAQAAAIAERLLAELGLSEQADVRLAGYSPDMCRRLAVARALVHEPAVLLLDQPTAGLDPDRGKEMLSVVRRIATQRGLTVLFTADRPGEVMQIGSSALLLGRGGPATFGPVDDVIRGLSRTEPEAT